MQSRGRQWSALGVALAATVVACSACSAADNSLGSGGKAGAGTPDGAADGGGAAGTGGGGGGPGGAGGAGGSPFDAPTSDKATPSCQFVDILFLVDNSPSMNPKQKKLAQAWPSFVDAMFAKLPPNVDLHVGLTTTSFFKGNCSEAVTNCASTASATEIAAHFVKPGTGDTGENGGQGRLFQYQGKRFFAANSSDADHGPLKAWFSGAADAAGETGCSFEFASAGVAWALDPVNATTNAGFLRDKDSVLLVFILSDEPDKSFEGVPTYHGMVTAAKQGCGGDKCVIVAGLVTPCVQATNQTVWQFMSSFGKPPVAWGDINGQPTEYTKVVGDALATVVKQTCDDIAIIK